MPRVLSRHGVQALASRPRRALRTEERTLLARRTEAPGRLELGRVDAHRAAFQAGRHGELSRARIFVSARERFAGERASDRDWIVDGRFDVLYRGWTERRPGEDFCGR